MKFLAFLILLNAHSVLASVQSTHKRYFARCFHKQVSLDKSDETTIPKTRISISEFEETNILNHEKTKETVMWKLHKRSINGQDSDIKDVNGISVYTFKKVSDSERSVHYLDTSEYLDFEDKPQTYIYEIDYNFKLLSEEEGKKIEEMTYLNEGQLVKALRVKTMKSPKDFNIEIFYLNPESLSNEYYNTLFAHRLCEYKEI